MKTLIAITSWVTGAINGENQAMRDTFLKDVPRYPGLDYKFFIGNGQSTGEDETLLTQSYSQVLASHGMKYDNRAPKPCHYDPKSDEVFLTTPDDFKHNCYKTKYNRRWANERKYDFVFQCTSDTYINIDRLMHSGFENHDYVGCTARCYARGGNGYWTSRRAYQRILDEPVTLWAEDWWVGTILVTTGIPLHNDKRYAEHPSYPTRDNDVISSHLHDGNTLYTPSMMYEVHKNN